MFAVLALIAFVRLRLLDLPLERDEGEYAYAGQLILQGIPPYELAYNMKFPGTYLAYATIMAVFGETPAGIHLGLLLMTTTTALMLFWLGKKILDETAGIVAATSYAMLAASPSMLGLAGHATHFCAFFVTAGLCGLWQARQTGGQRWLLVSGLAFGLAVLMKQHAVLIAAGAGLMFAVEKLLAARETWRRRLGFVAILGGAMALPLGWCGLWLWHAGVFAQFWFWTVDYARQYEQLTTWSTGWARFKVAFPAVVASTFILWLLAAVGGGLLWADGRLRGSRWFWLGLGLASALATVPGFYFRAHYFLVVLPAVALFAGFAISGLAAVIQVKEGQAAFRKSLLLVYAVLLAAMFGLNREVWFLTPPVQASKVIYGLPLFAEAEQVAEYIRDHSPATARIAVLGSEPEIYFLAHRRSATGYIYTYALLEDQPFAGKMQEEMIREIESVAPEFIIFVQGDTSWGQHKGSSQAIFQWWGTYRANYQRLELFANSQAGGKVGDVELQVYQRKPRGAGPSATNH